MENYSEKTLWDKVKWYTAALGGGALVFGALSLKAPERRIEWRQVSDDSSMLLSEYWAAEGAGEQMMLDEYISIVKKKNEEMGNPLDKGYKPRNKKENMIFLPELNGDNLTGPDAVIAYRIRNPKKN